MRNFVSAALRRTQNLAPEEKVAIYEDLLKSICCSICLQCPDLHLSESLSSELSLSSERLLRYKRVRAC